MSEQYSREHYCNNCQKNMRMKTVLEFEELGDVKENNKVVWIKNKGWLELWLDGGKGDYQFYYLCPACYEKMIA